MRFSIPIAGLAVLLAGMSSASAVAASLSFKDLSGWWSYPELSYTDGCNDEDGQYRAALGLSEWNDEGLLFGRGELAIRQYDGGCHVTNERFEGAKLLLDGACDFEGEEISGPVELEIVAPDKILLTTPIGGPTILEACEGTLKVALVPPGRHQPGQDAITTLEDIVSRGATLTSEEIGGLQGLLEEARASANPGDVQSVERIATLAEAIDAIESRFEAAQSDAAFDARWAEAEIKHEAEAKSRADTYSEAFAQANAETGLRIDAMHLQSTWLDADVSFGEMPTPDGVGIERPTFRQWLATALYAAEPIGMKVSVEGNALTGPSNIAINTPGNRTTRIWLTMENGAIFATAVEARGERSIDARVSHNTAYFISNVLNGMMLERYVSGEIPFVPNF